MNRHTVVVHNQYNIDETCNNITRRINSLYDVQDCPDQISTNDITIRIYNDFNWHHNYLRQLHIDSLKLIGLDHAVLSNVNALQYLPPVQALTIIGLIDIIPLGLIQSSMEELTIEYVNIGILNFITNNTLKTLSLYDCELTDIYGIQSLAAVEELFLESNFITDITPLSGGSYKSIYIRRNNIHDISPLIECPDLEVLDISYNPVMDADSLTHNIRLSVLIISDRFENTGLEQLLKNVDIEYVMDQ